MKFLKLLSLISVIGLAPSALFAHAHLDKANPEDGAVLKQAPEKIELSFSEAVQLLKFDVSVGGQPMQTGFEVSAEAKKAFAVTLPALEDATYEVTWTLLGDDGHRVEGSLGFSVDANADASAGKAGVSHAEHGH